MATHTPSRERPGEFREAHVAVAVALFTALTPVAGPASASDMTVTSVCQLQGEVAPVAADHPAAPFAGLPVTGHVIWVSIIGEGSEIKAPCAGGEISLNVGGTLRVSPISDEMCAVTPDPSGLSGRVEIDIPDSPFSPTLFAYGVPVDPRPATLTGLDELVIAGTCYVVSEDPVP